jgi:hypothetical protein
MPRLEDRTVNFFRAQLAGGTVTPDEIRAMIPNQQASDEP